ncbi:hypothetical protein BGZ83_008098 [Gryganskiella cystojenkinii]|nr:hypothetical protein BGZ83_008098 [Gryganskiella cystojenkinii]
MMQAQMEYEKLQKQRAKNAGVLRDYQSIRTKHQAEIARLKTDYSTSRAPVSKRNEDLLKRKVAKPGAGASEEERKKFRLYKEEYVAVSAEFKDLKNKLKADVEKFEKRYRQQIDALLVNVPDLPKEKDPTGNAENTNLSVGSNSIGHHGGSSSNGSSSSSSPAKTMPVSSRVMRGGSSSFLARSVEHISVKKEPMDDARLWFATGSAPTATASAYRAATVPRPVVISQPAPVIPPAVPAQSSSAPPSTAVARTVQEPVRSKVFSDKIARKAAGECILRAIIHTLSRGFCCMTLDVFLGLYCTKFGIAPKKGLFLPKRKPFGTILTKDGLYYGLNTEYLQELARRNRLPPLDVPNESLLIGVHNMDMLPPVKPMDPNLVRALVAEFEIHLYNIYDIQGVLLPTMLPADVPLQDFLPYLPLWNSTAPLPSPSSAIPGVGSGVLPDRVWAEQMSPELLQRYLRAAAMPGMEGKRAKKILMAHSAKHSRAVEKQRQDLLRASGELPSDSVADARSMKDDILVMGGEEEESMTGESSLVGEESDVDMDIDQSDDEEKQDASNSVAMSNSTVISPKKDTTMTADTESLKQVDVEMAEMGGDVASSSEAGSNGTVASSSQRRSSSSSSSAGPSPDIRVQFMEATRDSEADLGVGNRQQGMQSELGSTSINSSMRTDIGTSVVTMNPTATTPTPMVSRAPEIVASTPASAPTSAANRYKPYLTMSSPSGIRRAEGEQSSLTAVMASGGVNKERGTEGGAIRSQKGLLNRATPTTSGYVQMSGDGFALPRPTLSPLPDEPERPRPDWTNIPIKARFAGMTRAELIQARREAREKLIEWMWTLPLGQPRKKRSP